MLSVLLILVLFVSTKTNIATFAPSSSCDLLLSIPNSQIEGRDVIASTNSFTVRALELSLGNRPGLFSGVANSYLREWARKKKENKRKPPAENKTWNSTAGTGTVDYLYVQFFSKKPSQ